MTLTVVDETEFEQINDEILAEIQAELPDYDLVLSDPMVVNVRAFAYREWLLRRRINAVARGTFPQFALASDLDDRGTMYGVDRLTGETDEQLRSRVLAAPETFTTAGSVGSYEERTREVSALIKGVHVAKHTPVAGSVTVTVLSSEGDGAPDTGLLTSIESALNPDEIRPLCDTVYVQSAAVQAFTVDAQLTPYPNRDTALIEAAAREAVEAYVNARHQLGHDIELSGLYASLHVSGVKKVTLNQPAASIIRDDTEVAWCSLVTLGITAPDT